MADTWLGALYICLASLSVEGPDCKLQRADTVLDYYKYDTNI